MKNKILLVAALALLLSACTQDAAPEAAKRLTPVSLRLKWLHQAQFAGVYVAEDKGFYRQNGIELEEIAEFDFEHYPIPAVENQEVDFAITGADELILAQGRGQAQNVRAIAVVYKRNPVCLYSLGPSGITSPYDLPGKTVGIERGPDGTDINVGILYRAMLKKLGIDQDGINDITIGYDASELLAGETDVSSGYVINEPHQVIEAGLDVNTMLAADYGVNMYADVIITRQDTIKKRPEIVLAFLRATLDGWQYAIENEEEAVNITRQYALDTSFAHQKYMLEQSIPLIHTGDTPLGWMEKKDWEQAYRILQEQGQVRAGLDITRAYDMAALKSIYAR